METIGELVRQLETDYIRGQVRTSEYVEECFYDDVNKIEAYLNSKHTSGETDSLGRDKPFFNICVAKKNIVARATDLDRKNIRAKARKIKDYLNQYIYTIHLQKWMDSSDFGKFLNLWGDYLAAYNSAVCKFVEQNGELKSMVIPFTRLILDPIDFESNPVVEVLELTPAQLRKRKGYDKEMVEKLINAVSGREMLDGMKKDTKSNYIKLYEIHGELPLSYITGKENDDDTFVQQMQVVSFVAGKEKGTFDDFVLIGGREKKNPYMLTWLIPSTDGSISLNGSVKQLFTAQWMKNHTIKAIKDQLDLASKIWFQTCDPAFLNQNVFSSIETGQVAIWDKNIPNGRVEQVNNTSHDITALQQYGMQWDALAQDLTSTPDILQGDTLPSGTAFRQAAIVQQEAHSNFDMMIENKGLHIERMMRDYITPFILKKMDNANEVVATLDAYGIDKIDLAYISNESAKRFNKKAIQAVLNSEPLPDLNQEQMGVEAELRQMGGVRFLKPSDIKTKTWKDGLKEFKADVVYEITGENVQKQAVMDTLSSVFQTIVAMQGRPMTPQEKLVFNAILNETSAISPIELAQANSQPIPAMPTLQVGQKVGVGNPINMQKQNAIS